MTKIDKTAPDLDQTTLTTKELLESKTCKGTESGENSEEIAFRSKIKKMRESKAKAKEQKSFASKSEYVRNFWREDEK